jgi:hypothetical protein
MRIAIGSCLLGNLVRLCRVCAYAFDVRSDLCCVLLCLQDITPNWLRIPQNRVSLWKGCKKPTAPPAVKYAES